MEKFYHHKNETLFETLWDVNQAQTIDRYAQQELGYPAAILMENAGRMCAQDLLRLREDGELSFNKVLVLVGPGHNGGDGLVIARYLHEAGVEVRIQLGIMPDLDKAPPAWLQNFQICQKLGLSIEVWEQKSSSEGSPDSMPDLIVDGIFGLGVCLPLKNPYKDWLAHWGNSLSCGEKIWVAAVDLPSGLSGDVGPGPVEAPYLKADLTYTFGRRKPAHVIQPTAFYCGQVRCFDIGFPQKAVQHGLHQHPSSYLLYNKTACRRVFEKSSAESIPPYAHKYMRGHCLIVGGSPGMRGAVAMAAQGALQAGAGWVSVAMPHLLEKDEGFDLIPSFPAQVVGVPGIYDQENLSARDLLAQIEERHVSSLVLGPGWTQNLLSSGLLADLLVSPLKKIILDAGALKDIWPLLISSFLKLSSKKDVWRKPVSLILTPHPGEWARMGWVSELIPDPRYAIGLRQAQICMRKALGEGSHLLDLQCLYKSASPILIRPEGPGRVLEGAQPELARAGTGDFLSGLIGGAPFVEEDLALLMQGYLYESGSTI